MTDKLERLSRIEAEAAALRKEIEAESKKTVCFAPDEGERYWQLIGGSDGKHLLGTSFDLLPPKAAFRDQKTAEAYAEAFNVMLELRLYADGGGWFIGLDIRGALGALWHPSEPDESDAFAGRYSSEAQAQKAIDAVGEDRIIQAIKTLRGGL